jgi:hypothetical protein
MDKTIKGVEEMRVEWRELKLPDFGLPQVLPEIPARLYEERCRQAYSAAGCNWLVVYGDREHYANLAYLTNFDPRFEEAVLLLGPHETRMLLVGNEGLGYASMVSLRLNIMLCQSFSLMGQDRSLSPRLLDILSDAGIKRGQSVGVVGWKYLEPFETMEHIPGFFAPALLVDSLRVLVGDPNAIVDATWVLMHPTHGLRARNEVEQIAAFEWAAARATLAVLQVLRGVRPGMTELQAVSNMRFSGEPLSAHVMFSSGRDVIVGLRSPTTRVIERGTGATIAVGFWGGLGCRAGLIDEQEPDFLGKIAIPYFRGLATWYQTVRLGVAGETIFGQVSEALAQGGLGPMLNPGHLTSLDEWVHTPIRHNSSDSIASGMAFQCDIIPVPMPPGWAMNCEDPVVFADEALRKELSQRFPTIWSRMRARQEFMRQELGVQICDEVLPLSTAPAYLPPLWLSSSRVLTVT